jgi:hypothetical protein
MPHEIEEVRRAVNHDREDRLNVLQVQISNMRKVLRLQGQDIICEFANRRRFYRHIKLLTSSDSSSPPSLASE